MTRHLIRATWDLSGEFPVISYTVSGLSQSRVERIARMLAGCRRQRKRALRLLRQHNSFFPARPAQVAMGDEVDAFVSPALNPGFVQELTMERLRSFGWEKRT